MDEPEAELRKKLAEGKKTTSASDRQVLSGPVDPTVGVTENRNRLILEQITPRIKQWLDEELTHRVHEQIQTAVPAFVESYAESYWDTLRDDRLPDLIESVSKHLYETYFDPDLPDSPLAALVRDLVKEHLEPQKPTPTKPTESAYRPSLPGGRVAVPPPRC